MITLRSGHRGEAIEALVVPANHSNARGPHSRIVAEPVGYVIRAGGRSVYFAGDTDLFEGMHDFPRSTWHCCRSGAGARRSASATSTPSGRPPRRTGSTPVRRADPLGDVHADHGPTRHPDMDRQPVRRVHVVARRARAGRAPRADQAGRVDHHGETVIRGRPAQLTEPSS